MYETRQFVLKILNFMHWINKKQGLQGRKNKKQSRTINCSNLIKCPFGFIKQRACSLYKNNLDAFTIGIAAHPTPHPITHQPVEKNKNKDLER
jgi:hypothetical protein